MAVQERVLQATIRARDMFTATANRVIASTQRLRSITNIITRNPLVMKAKDMASRVISSVRNKLEAFKNTRLGQILISAKDKATSIIKSIGSKLKAFTKGNYQAIVKVKDAASSVLGGIKGKLAALAGGITIAVAAKIGFDGLSAEQNQKITINRVIQNGGKTKEQAKKATEEYYKYLEDFANKTPFSTADVAVMGTKSMMLAKGNVEYAKTVTDAMANTKAFVGDLRTSQEVAEAFFSAGNGNMDMLNNMLGEKYKTMDEALKGIKKKQGGLVDEMASTVGGLWSTVMGKTQAGLKDIVKQFEPFISGVLNGVISGIDTFLPKIIGGFEYISNFMTLLFKGDSANLEFPMVENLLNAFNALKTVIEPVVVIISEQFTKIFTIANEKFGGIGSIIEGAAGIISTVIGGLTPVLQLLAPVFEYICNVAQIVWPVIQGIIEIAAQVIKDVVNALKPVFDSVNNVMSLIGQTVAEVWPSIQDTIENVWSNLQPVLDLFKSIATNIADIFVQLWPGISEAVKTVWGIVGPIFEGMSKILGTIANLAKKVIDGVSGAVKAVKESNWNPFNWFGGGNKNNNAYGKRIVPYNGYQATLHEGERVLTKQEARQLDAKGGFGNNGININMNGVTIREEADIERIAQAFMRELNKAKLSYGGEY